jgi:hypothetical protein
MPLHIIVIPIGLFLFLPIIELKLFSFAFPTLIPFVIIDTAGILLRSLLVGTVWLVLMILPPYDWTFRNSLRSTYLGAFLGVTLMGLSFFPVLFFGFGLTTISPAIFSAFINGAISGYACSKLYIRPQANAASNGPNR